ncbi:hypothetical protein B0H13DRAFT_2021492 [Mycena leptocephala]|nr:hypothetical protein B0H13DRAFT_2021492 [Mycena leptocephala]
MLTALEADRNSVAAIDAEILRLERSLSGLRTAKAVLKQRLESYQYPVLTLPNEIVSEIFIHFLPKVTDRTGYLRASQLCSSNDSAGQLLAEEFLIGF